MLRTCNRHVASGSITPARLTMKFEMARLYSVLRARGAHLVLSFPVAGTEWRMRINRIFCDILSHFHCGGVAKRRHSVAGPLVVAVGLFAGCAGIGGPSGDGSAHLKRDAVAQRAKARWDRLIARDLAGAYQYLSPASRATTPLEVYKAKHKVGMYRSVTVDNVNCEEDACTVTLRLTYDFKQTKGITTPLTERWIISQGQAWFVDGG
jgi:hypothetical protein